VTDYTSLNINNWNKFALTTNQWDAKLELYSHSLLKFLDYLPNPISEVLELACGTGLNAKFLLQHRPKLEIMLTDAAPAMVDLAQKNNPTISCQILEFNQLKDLKKQYNAIIISFGIPYIDIIQLGELISVITEKLHNQGIIYLSYIIGKYSDSGLFRGSSGEIKCQMFFYENEFIRKLMLDHGFEIVEIFDVIDPNTHSFQSSQQILIARLLKNQ
jgi:predicted TPR repeat methyltransferase